MSENKFAILIDSTGDLTKELREKFDIDYCAMSVNIDGKDVVASLDYDQGYSLKDFADYMRGGKRIFTAQVSQEEFSKKFKEHLDKGEDIIYLACSGKLSKSVDFGRLIADKLKGEYPERKIYVVDSLISCIGQGGLALMASDLRAEGKSIEEVVAWLEKNKLKMNQFATVENLTWLKRVGRVSAGSAFFGNIIGIKPIIISDTLGHNFAVKKVKGKKPSWIEVAESLLASVEDVKKYPIYIGDFDNVEGADFIADYIKQKAPEATIVRVPIGPIIGASCGPAVIGAFTFGKKVTVTGGDATK